MGDGDDTHGKLAAMAAVHGGRALCIRREEDGLENDSAASIAWLMMHAPSEVLQLTIRISLLLSSIAGNGKPEAPKCFFFTLLEVSTLPTSFIGLHTSVEFEIRAS